MEWIHINSLEYTYQYEHAYQYEHSDVDGNLHVNADSKEIFNPNPNFHKHVYTYDYLHSYHNVYTDKHVYPVGHRDKNQYAFSNGDPNRMLHQSQWTFRDTKQNVANRPQQQQLSHHHLGYYDILRLDLTSWSGLDGNLCRRCAHLG